MYVFICTVDYQVRRDSPFLPVDGTLAPVSCVIVAEVKRLRGEERLVWLGLNASKTNSIDVQSRLALISVIRRFLPFSLSNGRVGQDPGPINGTESRRVSVMLRRARQSLRQLLNLMARRPGLLCGTIVLGVLLILAIKLTYR